MGKEKIFLERERISMDKLHRAIDSNKVDEKIMNIINAINRREEYFTTSSCAGRIILIQVNEAGDKKNADFIGKWHEKVELEEILNSLKCSDGKEVWFMVNPPIIHVGCRTLNDAKKLLTIANRSGFKHSSVKSIGDVIFIEILSTERMDVPVCVNGERVVSKKYIAMLVKIANKMMDRIDEKLKRLEKELSHLL